MIHAESLKQPWNVIEESPVLELLNYNEDIGYIVVVHVIIYYLKHLITNVLT